MRHAIRRLRAGLDERVGAWIRRRQGTDRDPVDAAPRPHLHPADAPRRRPTRAWSCRDAARRPELQQQPGARPRVPAGRPRLRRHAPLPRHARRGSSCACSRPSPRSRARTCASGCCSRTGRARRGRASRWPRAASRRSVGRRAAVADRRPPRSRVHAERRGRVRLDRFVLATRHPLGLFRAWAVVHPGLFGHRVAAARGTGPAAARRRDRHRRRAGPRAEARRTSRA